MKSKVSYGIALCRYNKEKNNRIEILLIKKRYSYHFMSFVMGHYKKSDTAYLKHLFNNMSYAEKIDIISMQFSQMWYRIWLNNPDKYYNIVDVYKNNKFSSSPLDHKYDNSSIHKMYMERKLKFESSFLKDNGKRLRSLIQQSSDSEILWEIPKGGKNTALINGKEETNIDCAIREFYEETSIKDNKYKIIYNAKPIIDSYVDNDINYKTIYYVASLNPPYDYKPYIDYRNFDQIAEIEQIKWVSLAEIEFFNLSAPIHARLIRLYKEIIKTFKKNSKFRKLH